MKLLGSFAFFWLAIIVYMVADSVMAENNCVRWGERRVSFYQQVGSVMVPIYTEDCLEWKDD